MILNPSNIPVVSPNEYSIQGEADFHPIVIIEINCGQLTCTLPVVLFLRPIVLFGDACPTGISKQHISKKPNCHNFSPVDPPLLIDCNLS